MSWLEDLAKRRRDEIAASERQAKDMEARVQETARHLRPTVKRLLVDLGKAYWGKVFWPGDRPSFLSPFQGTSWTIAKGSEYWTVVLSFSDDGSQYFTITCRGPSFVKTRDTSEDALKLGLREAFAAGPAWHER